MAEKTGGIYAKLARVMAAAERIPKNGYNNFHKYHYVQEADLSQHVRQLLIEHGLLFLPSADAQNVIPQGDNFLTQVDMTMRIVDVDTGEQLEFRWQAQGQDKGDKGVYKAMTGGVKYFWMKALLLPTGDDPEEDTHMQSGRQKNQGKGDARHNRIYATANKKGVDDAGVKLLASYSVKRNIASLTELSDEELAAFEKRLKEANPADLQAAVKKLRGDAA